MCSKAGHVKWATEHNYLVMIPIGQHTPNQHDEANQQIRNNESCTSPSQQK